MKDQTIKLSPEFNNYWEWECAIPEDMEAEIKDGKIVVKKKESEDERIKKIIVLALIASEDELSAFYSTHNITRKECTDWLEKQKEQKPDSIRIECKEHDERREEIRVTEIIESIIRVYGKTQGEFIAGYDIDTLIHWVREAFDCLNKQNIQKEQKPADEQFPPLEGLDAIKAKYYDDGFKNGFDEGVESVKPAEWNEEDRTNLKFCIYSLHQYGYMTYANFLKHLPERFNLQPKQDWKPSEEQMGALKSARYMMSQGGDYYDTAAIIDSLITDLQKLL